MFPRRRKKTTFFENLDKISTNYWKTIKWKQNVHTNDQWFQLQFWNDFFKLSAKTGNVRNISPKTVDFSRIRIAKTIKLMFFFLRRKDTALFKINVLCDLWGFHKISYRQIFDIFAAIKNPELLSMKKKSGRNLRYPRWAMQEKLLLENKCDFYQNLEKFILKSWGKLVRN